MKKLFAGSIVLLCLYLNVSGQFLPGINTSNYNGVLGTFSNPANTLGKYKYDVSLLGFSIAAANENSKIKLSDIGEANFVKDKLIGTSGYNTGNLNLDIPALGILIGAGKKMSFAFTSRGRVFVNANHIDAKLISDITEDAESGSGNYPYLFEPGNPSLVTASAITDYGFTWANEIWKKGPHYIKGGVTVKYVSGVGNLSIDADIAGRLDEDDKGLFFSNVVGSISSRNGGSAFEDDFEINELVAFKGGGVGFDLGLTYEYRPESWNDAATKKDVRAHGHVPYQFRFNASVMDIGKVSYTFNTDLSKGYSVRIPSSEEFYQSILEGADIRDINEIFDAYPQYFTQAGEETGKYKVSLPTTLRLNVDYNIGKGFFVNLDAQLAMQPANSRDVMKVYNTYSITPRFDGRLVGCFLPVTISQLSGVNVGAAFHLGPLYIGSGSILSLLTGGSKQADAFFGFRTGGLKAKQAPKLAKTID